jgi:hypothetical protein
MRIDKKLHLIVPIYQGEEGDSPVVAHVHSMPLGEAVVDRYFMVLGQTYSAIFSQGLGLAGGPPHAMRVLRHIATERGVWHDDPKTGAIGVEHGLVEEMRRLTMVAALNKEGRWVDLPLQIAVDQGILSSEDKAEVENAIAFFIAASATLNRAQRPAMVKAAAELWGAQISSSTFTEFLTSLRTSTATGSSGEKSPAPASEKPAPANAMVAGKPASIPV